MWLGIQETLYMLEKILIVFSLIWLVLPPLFLTRAYLYRAKYLSYHSILIVHGAVLGLVMGMIWRDADVSGRLNEQMGFAAYGYLMLGILLLIAELTSMLVTAAVVSKPSGWMMRIFLFPALGVGSAAITIFLFLLFSV